MQGVSERASKLITNARKKGMNLPEERDLDGVVN